MKQYFIYENNGRCLEEQIIQGEKYRISVLTSGLIRFEYNEVGIFEDRMTQTVIRRDFRKCEYEVKRKKDQIEIRTEKLIINYDEKKFSDAGLQIEVRECIMPYGNIWTYDKEKPDIDIPVLKGTARTLDGADGEIPLEEGIISQFGYAVLDDSNSMIINEDGWVEKKEIESIDFYFWGYGKNYIECLKDYYYLTGPNPMIPRYALGNWWSRYYQYTQESYKTLITKFKKNEIPFSVAVIDMDWHLVDINPKYGSGWTGYTWNRNLFPDPDNFLFWLHENDLHVTLNVHPAGGVRAFEDAYPQMANKLGINSETEETIAFNASNQEFLISYFEELHHPLEKQGVDFWWIDWQQGSKGKGGIDPLWMLNHYHFLDSGREGKRSMTFSRYAGPGSHRYPVGFSGDTITTWESLEFQPYFTATASNIGYAMWSHDIGGHMNGYKDDDLSLRWLQFGVFSPIMRLHSSNSAFNSKEPWNYKKEVELNMISFLQLRHRLVPYLYSMIYRQYHEGLALCLPMYYFYPENQEAYAKKNQYFFGTSFIVAPITKQIISGLNMASVDVWLPEGDWIDFFTGIKYNGNREIKMFRDLSSIPVLAKAGSIIPMMHKMESTNINPQNLELIIYPQEDGTFELYEDDNMTEAYKKNDCLITKLNWNWGDKIFSIEAAEGNLELSPKFKNYELVFVNSKFKECDLNILNHKIEYTVTQDEERTTVILNKVPTSKSIDIVIKNYELVENDYKKMCFNILKKYEGEYYIKEKINRVIEKNDDKLKIIGQLQGIDITSSLLDALIEVITA